MIVRPSHLLLTTCMLLLLAACSSTPSLEADIDFDSTFDFSRVTKVNMQPARRLDSTAAVLISDMGIGRINDALADELVRRGFVIVPDAADADLIVSWHLVTREQMDIRAYDSLSYYNCWRCGPTVSDLSVREYTQGTLIVDMIDPSIYKSVWRSVVQSRLRSQPSEQASQEFRREAAQAIFSGFPPTGAPAT